MSTYVLGTSAYHKKPLKIVTDTYNVNLNMYVHRCTTTEDCFSQVPHTIGKYFNTFYNQVSPTDICVFTASGVSMILNIVLAKGVIAYNYSHINVIHFTASPR